MNHTTAAFTVVTPNFLAQAIVLKASFLRHNDNAVFFTCIVGSPSDMNGIQITDTCFITDLHDDRIAGMTQRYNPFELSASLKPYFAVCLLERNPQLQRLIYLDGDTCVFGKLNSPSDAAIILSPHRTRNIHYLPGPDNYSTISLNRYGVYNSGYFEINRKEEGLAFLDWWKARLELHAFNRPDEFLFTDQLWLDCVHSFFDDIFINKNPGVNVGFWNLVERTITSSNNRFLVNGEPLLLFHFSHYRPEQPERMVSFDHPFLSFDNLPELKPIFYGYREALLQAGYQELKNLPYPFAVAAKKKKWSLKKLFSRAIFAANWPI